MLVGSLRAVNSIYWVVSRDCNQRCAHCYNDFEPGAPGLGLEDVSVCVANLPDPGDAAVDRIILSGGEVLVWPDLLFHTLRALQARYGDRTALMVRAIVDEVAEEFDGQLTVGTVDAHREPELLGRYGIRFVPALLFVRGGAVVDCTFGRVPKQLVLGKLATLVGSSTREVA
ncbi:MAG TPA: thioredoxin domain-containing protein [Candidatus Limnocylindria bacterium]|nr:thioredoxin domain-containing protein [Candidatus Limnocylindria bacterium]